MAGKTEYKNKYAAENYDRVGLMLPKGTKDIIKSAAQKSGNSINSYIYAAISDKLTADGFKPVDKSQD